MPFTPSQPGYGRRVPRTRRAIKQYRRPSKSTTARSATRTISRAPPSVRAKAVRTVKRAYNTSFSRKINRIVNRKAETFRQVGRALYSPPLSAPIFQSASYHLFNLTGSAPIDGQTLVPQELLGLVPEAYNVVAPTFLQGGYRGTNVFGKSVFSTIKLTMPVLEPEQITPPLDVNQSQFFAQNWNIRLMIFKSKPFPSTSVIAGGQMLKPMDNIFKSYINSNFGPATSATEAPVDSVTGTSFWTSDDLQWSRMNSTNYTKLLEKRFKMSLPQFVAYDANRQDPTAPSTTPYVTVGGGKKHPSERTIHFNHKINKKLQYATENELPPDVKRFPLNNDNTIMCMVTISPVGGTTNVQDFAMNAFIANSIKLDVQSTFTYQDM